MIVTFTSPLWPWDARRDDAWVFVTVPAEDSAEIRDLTAGPRRGFGSVRVRATIGATVWRTSIFPGGDGYVLPLKRAVRRAQNLEIGDVATVTIELVDL